MSKPRYLTKSRFKLALECPTKLYYTGKPQVYADSKVEDPFLQALANGGYQVGELAKRYFEGGTDIVTLDYDEALAQTAELMKADQCTIYEAAIKHQDLFIRVDILVKKGSQIDFYEVKSKSFDSTDDHEFVGKRGGIVSDWRPYLEDAAFQRYVIQEAFPDHRVTAHLMMAEKNTLCPVDGLNQKFRVTRDDRRRKCVQVSAALTADDLVEPRILQAVNVELYCDQIYAEAAKDHEQGYAGKIAEWAKAYKEDRRLPAPFSLKCKKCEFYATEEERKAGLKSGKFECWNSQLGWDEQQASKPNVLNIWSLHWAKAKKLIEAGQIALHDIGPADIKPSKSDKAADDGRPVLSAHQRRVLQIEKVLNKDDSYYLDEEGLAAEMAGFEYPLTFIDFETAMAAVPFNQGRKPYESIAFQYSIHRLSKDGQVSHDHEFLEASPGKFPNYEFLRSLKRDLQGSGTVFRYAAHENSILVGILKQLNADPAPPEDAEALKTFIREYTHSPGKEIPKWEGPRSMVDLCRMVKDYFYDPRTGGSNSIKYVLPAVLGRSDYLKKKYGQAIYGAEGGIPSLNFKDWQWVQLDEAGKVKDPYHLLPPVFSDIKDRAGVWISDDEEDIHEGGAAMTAYVRMQFEEMGDAERQAIRKALLKYCELDTLAMVMLFEGWQDLLGQKK